MKLAILIFLIGLLIGCGAGNPVPPEAFTGCYDRGFKVYYDSGMNGTNFRCMKL